MHIETQNNRLVLWDIAHLFTLHYSAFLRKKV